MDCYGKCVLLEKLNNPDQNPQAFLLEQIADQSGFKFLPVTSNLLVDHQVSGTTGCLPGGAVNGHSFDHHTRIFQPPEVL